MGIEYYVKAPISEFKGDDGQMKKRYQIIGIVMTTKNGDLMLKLESIPLLGLKDGSLWAYLNKPELENKPSEDKKSLKDLDSDIPF